MLGVVAIQVKAVISCLVSHHSQTVEKLQEKRGIRKAFTVKSLMERGKVCNVDLHNFVVNVSLPVAFRLESMFVALSIRIVTLSER